MTKIIYSIAAALLLSVILTLLIPEWFFKGDAYWTYQNDAARLDVSFSGHLKHGRVGAAGENLRVRQPAWLSNSDYQGTCVEMPVSYRNRIYQIKLTPQADEWGTDVALVIKFMGRDFQHEGQRKPAWVCFRNISLNGEPVAAEKIVWHNEPFTLKYPSHTSEITLTFDVYKPFAASDIAFANLLVLFSAFLLLCLFFAPLKRVAEHVLLFINRKDIAQVISDGYLNIDPVYRRSFWIICGVLCCAFGLHTIWFMWGNHDWPLLQYNQRWLARATSGRYMIYSVKMLLSGGIYLPFIYDLITFITLAFNAILLCVYWRLRKRVVYFVICGLILTVQPFTLSMGYFVHMIPEVFIGVTCVLSALLLSEKIAAGDFSLTRKLFYSFIAIVLVNFALAMYPVLINTVAVVFLGRLLVQSLDWDGSRQKLRSYLTSFMVSSINIVSGIALYKLIVTYVFPVLTFYNTETIPLARVPERLGVLLKQCIHQLYEYDMPFLPQWILWVFLGFTIILGTYICCMGNLKQKIVRFLLLFGSLLATQTAMVIAREHLIDGRVELFGLVFFEVLVVALVFTQLRKLHNISVIACVCIIFASVIHDLDCLRVWKLGFDAEKMLWNRVLARLEIQDGFVVGRKYDVVQIGEPISFRPRFYTKAIRGYAAFMLKRSYDPNYNPFSAHQLYYSSTFNRLKRISIWQHRQEWEARLKRLYQAGVLQKAGVWPRPNGLIVWKDIIIFVTDAKELERCKKQFERELGKK